MRTAAAKAMCDEIAELREALARIGEIVSSVPSGKTDAAWEALGRARAVVESAQKVGVR